METATFPSRAAWQTSTRGSHDDGKDVYETGERPRGWGWRPRPPEAQQGQLQVRLRPKLHALSQPCFAITTAGDLAIPSSTDTHPPNPAPAIPLFPIRDRPVYFTPRSSMTDARPLSTPTPPRARQGAVQGWFRSR